MDELCGITTRGETLRRHCPVAGRAMNQWVRTQPAAAARFRAASGEVEVQTDAGKVNTTAGWRDLKVLVFAKRPRGPAADPTEWTTRELLTPTARAVFTDIEEIGTFRADWRGWADRWGVGSGPELTVFGDGAEWIWSAAAAQFPACRQVLDVFHAPEHVGTAAEAMYGDGTEPAGGRFAAGKAQVLARGWAGVCPYAGDELSREDTPARRAALDELIGYVTRHVGRMDYRARLADGRAIGSG